MYWQEHKREAIKEARMMLEFFFEIPVTMSDRMFLKKYVLEAIDQISINKSDILYSADPVFEGVGKFLMIHYNFRDLKKIQRICMGYTDDLVSRLLVEHNAKANF